MSRPRIGISCDNEVRPVREVPLRHNVLQHTYVQAVEDTGGVPFILPNAAPALAAEYLAMLDGLILSGGDFDVDPALYNEPQHEKLGALKPERSAFERALLSAAEARNLPVLGICGGMQLMNVMRGGSLYQDLPSQKPGEIAHTQIGDRRVPGHTVTLAPTGWLAQLIGPDPLGVNSTHHQAIKTLGQGLVVEATAPDGIVEAFSDPSRRFFVGIEWHPEALSDSARQLPIYAALVRASTV